MSPRLSFVITGFNAEPTVQRAVRSALDQVGADVEVVYVDDGSDDASLRVVERIDDRRLTTLEMGHVGRATALNQGIAASTAPLIAILDADDAALPLRASIQIAFLDEHPDCELLGGQLRVTDPSGRIDQSGRLSYPTSPRDIDARIARGQNPIAHPAAVFRRDWFDRVGPYDPTVKRVEDFDLILRGWSPGRYAAVDQVVTRYAHPLFPSWRYWRRENAYRRAVHRRWAAGRTHEPLELDGRMSDAARDAVVWAGQRVRYRA